MRLPGLRRRDLRPTQRLNPDFPSRNYLFLVIAVFTSAAAFAGPALDQLQAGAGVPQSAVGAPPVGKVVPAPARPLPPGLADTPDQWARIRLATLHYDMAAEGSGSDMHFDADVFVGKSILDITKDRPQFMPAGRDFQDAVRLARKLAAEPEKWQSARAVLKADDGQYYVTSIRNDRGSLRIDGRNYGWDKIKAVSGDRAVTALQAIVGEEKIIDFTSAATAAAR